MKWDIRLTSACINWLFSETIGEEAGYSFRESATDEAKIGTSKSLSHICLALVFFFSACTLY